MKPDTLLLGVDGGGTRCRARLCSLDGAELGEAVNGPANIRLGLDQSLNSIVQVVRQCLAQAGLTSQDLRRIMACLALAGGHIDRLAERLIELGAQKLALVGGLAPIMIDWISDTTRKRLVRPEGDALDGAVRLARSAVDAMAA